MLIVKPSAKLNWITPNAAEQIERIARTCYKSEDKIGPGTAAKMIHMLIEREHLAMIEHASASIHFVCDRGVSHEMVRHRLASYAQESTRYCNYAINKFGNEITIVRPLEWNCPSDDIWYEAMRQAETHYLNLIRLKVSPQMARSVLPNSLKTEIHMTCNFREWLHFFKMRTAPAAHPQMREIALMALQILSDKCPEVFRQISNEAEEKGLASPSQLEA